MSVSLDDLIAEIDQVIPGNGILRTHQRLGTSVGSAENPLAVFILTMVRDLYDEDSSEVANMERLATAVGLASYELEKLEKQLHQASQKQAPRTRSS
jgi:hypothetical protein